jgi:hypothetical protein
LIALLKSSKLNCVSVGPIIPEGLIVTILNGTTLATVSQMET